MSTENPRPRLAAKVMRGLVSLASAAEAGGDEDATGVTCDPSTGLPYTAEERAAMDDWGRALDWIRDMQRWREIDERERNKRLDRGWR